jgi:ADP-ribose pyrophosphatase YjhB (NUDIX family)
MSVKIPIADFCPACGAKTQLIDIHGRQRPQCISCGHIVYFDPKVAAIALITRDDRILLGQRSNDPGKGKWGLPGGFVEFGEHPRDAVQREVLEETHLIVEVGDVIDVFHTSGSTTITIAYHVDIVSGIPEADDDVRALGWFARDSIPELFFISTIMVVDRWLKGQLT